MNSIIELSNSEPKSYVYGEKTKTKYELTERMYACLDVSGKSPLSAVCVTGNSFSIDPWTGCALQCAYCHVQGVAEDLNETGKMRTIPCRRTCFDDMSICEALVNYPLFDKDDSIISIGTSSTEPFAVGDVLESTLGIMEWFVEKGLLNPFWVVTKAGIPDAAIDRIKKISKTNRIVISFCYGNNSKSIEPAQNDRFLNIEKISDEDNIFCNWYFRPLVRDWNREDFNFDKIFSDVSKKYGKHIKAIVPGGLRWTEGIEYGLKEVRGIELPRGISRATRHQKSLTLSEFLEINECVKRYFPDIPVFNHSACMVSYFLNKQNIAMIEERYSEECHVSLCPSFMREKCNSKKHINISKLNDLMKQRGLDFVFEANSEIAKGYRVCPSIESFSPAIRQRVVYYISCCLEEDSVE